MAFLILFGLGWGFFDCNNMPILSQIVRPHLRATGYGIMNFVSISCGGLADWGFGVLRDRQVPLSLIFGVIRWRRIVSIFLVLLIGPNNESICTGSGRMTFKLRGLVAATHTPFNSDGQLNLVGSREAG